MLIKKTCIHALHTLQLRPLRLRRLKHIAFRVFLRGLIVGTENRPPLSSSVTKRCNEPKDIKDLLVGPVPCKQESSRVLEDLKTKKKAS